MDNILVGVLAFFLGAQLQKDGTLDKLIPKDTSKEETQTSG